MPVKSAYTKDMSREEWLKLRKQGIGGSDAGAVCGVNPYRSAFSVYMDKTADREEEWEDNEAIRQGHDLEEYCARRFTEATGLKVRRSNFMYQHDEYPFMLADVDRMIVGENAGLECKTASAWNADKWKALESLPESYILQCQHYMSVMDWEYMYLACVVLGKEFVYYRIDRDESLITSMIQLEQRFWEDNVLQRIIPDPDGSKDYDLMLNTAFHAEQNATIPLIGFDKELQRRSQIQQLLSKMEKEKKEIDQKLKLYMKENETAENEKYRVTWKFSESTGTRRFNVREAA